MKEKFDKPEFQCLTEEKEVRYQANPNYILREIAGEYILVPTGRELENFNGLATMNETGVFLWKLLEEKNSLEEIVDHFKKEYDLITEECWEDVKEFLQLAISKNMILKF